jgi:hypothetical protein
LDGDKEKMKKVMKILKKTCRVLNGSEEKFGVLSGKLEK